MARVVETDEPPVVREERVEHIHDTGARRGPGAGVVIAIIILILILIAIFWWRPWGGTSSGGGGGTNINVTAPSSPRP